MPLTFTEEDFSEPLTFTEDDFKPIPSPESIRQGLGAVGQAVNLADTALRMTDVGWKSSQPEPIQFSKTATEVPQPPSPEELATMAERDIQPSILEHVGAAALNIPASMYRSATGVTPKVTVAGRDEAGRQTIEEQPAPLPFQPGKPVFEFPRTVMQPEGNQLTRLAEGLLTPGMLASFPFAATKPAQIYFLSQTVPGAIEAATRLVSPDTPPDERRAAATDFLLNTLMSYGIGKHLTAKTPITTEVQNAGQITSTEGVPEHEVRARMGEETPLRPEGEVAPARVEEATRPTAESPESKILLTEAKATADEIGSVLDPESQTGGAVPILTKEQLAQQTPEIRALYEKIYAEQKPEWEFTDPLDSPTAGATFRVPVGSVKADIIKAAKLRRAQELIPVLRTKSGEIIRGKKGDTHEDIYEENGGAELKITQPEHGFEANTGFKKTFLSRAEAAKLLSEKDPLTSQRLKELQSSPNAPKAAATGAPTESPVGEQRPASAAATEATPEMAAVGAGPGARTSQPSAKPEAPEAYDATSLKNAVADLERAGLGLPDATPTQRRVMAERWIDSGKKLAQDPTAGKQIADAVIENPRRGMTDDESALLLRHKVSLFNALNEAAEQTHVGTPEARSEALLRYARLSDQFNTLLDAIKERGSEWGREGRWRQAMAWEDYSFATQERLLRVDKGGQPLTDLERNRLLTEIEVHKQKVSQLQEYLANRDKRIAEMEARAALDKIRKPPVKRTPTADIETRKRDVTAKIKDRVDGGKKNEITPLVQRLARMFVEQGIKERDALIDAVHGVLKEIVPDITRRETMDAISGYGDYKQLTKDEISVQLRDLKGQMQQIGKLEDMQAGKPPVKTGLERRIPSKEESRLIKLVNEAKRQFQIPIDDPNTQLKSSLDMLKKRITTRIEDLNARIASGEFSNKPRREIVLDKEAMRLTAEKLRVEQRFADARRNAELKQRPMPQKIFDFFTKWLRREFVLSSPISLVKLTAAAVEGLTFEPIKEVVGAGVARAFPRFAARTEAEGASSIKIESRALAQAFTRAMSDAAQTLKTGRSDLEMAFGGRHAVPAEMQSYFGRLHAALKTPLKRAAFERVFTKLAAREIQNGVDVTEPLVQMRMGTVAMREANRVLFLEDNMMVSAYRRLLSRFEEKNKSTGKPTWPGLAAAGAAHTILPIVRIPTNLVARTVQAAAGFPVGATKLAIAYARGIEKLPPEQADLIMRQIKQGSIGGAFMLAGFFAPQMFGGYYQPGEKRKPGELKAGHMKVGDVDVPPYLLHHPILQVMQLGATMRQVADSKLHKKDTAQQGIGAGALAGMLGLIEEVPFVREMLDLEKLRNPYTREKYLGSEAASIMTPQLSQWLAKHYDQTKEGEPVARSPQTLWQNVEMGIPGLRQNVPGKLSPYSAFTE